MMEFGARAVGLGGRVGEAREPAGDEARSIPYFGGDQWQTCGSPVSRRGTSQPGCATSSIITHTAPAPAAPAAPAVACSIARLFGCRKARAYVCDGRKEVAHVQPAFSSQVPSVPARDMLSQALDQMQASLDLTARVSKVSRDLSTK